METHHGVVYAYKTVGAYGSGVYYFCRTKQQVVYDMSLEGVQDGVHERQVRMLQRQCSRNGLHSPRTVLLWGRTVDVERAWDSVKDFLRGNRILEEVSIKHEAMIGDNWWSCDSHKTQAFGFFLRRVWNVIHANPEEQVIVDSGADSDSDEESTNAV
jgi:hypothetical protein